MNDFNMTFDSGEDLNMGFRELQVEVPAMHNGLAERDAENAHPMSAITGLEANFAEAFAAIEEKVNKAYVDGEIARVEGEIPSLDGYATERYVDEAVAEVQGDVDGIEAKIPAQATPQNKLADKEFVNSSISTNTATFRGTYTSTDDFPTTGVDDNDYVFLKVMSTEEPTQVERYDRYKWNGTQFAFEFSLNNSSFTAEQWAAINSGITASDLSSIKDNIQQLQSGKVDKETGKGLSTNDYTTTEKNKLASLENYDDTDVVKYTEQTKTDFEKAQARENIGAEKKHSQYELIETITLTEEVTDFIRNLEPDGTPYNFKSIYFELTSSYLNDYANTRRTVYFCANTSAWAWVSVRGSCAFDLDSQGNRFALATLNADKGLIEPVGGLFTQSSELTANTGPITSILLHSSSLPLPIGLRIKIFGVRV